LRDAQRLALAGARAADAVETEAEHAEDLPKALEHAAIGLAEAGLQSDAVAVNARLLFIPGWSRAVARLVDLSGPASWLPAFAAAYAPAGQPT
jgi:hypothetical protein